MSNPRPQNVVVVRVLSRYLHHGAVRKTPGTMSFARSPVIGWKGDGSLKLGVGCLRLRSTIPISLYAVAVAVAVALAVVVEVFESRPSRSARAGRSRRLPSQSKYQTLCLWQSNSRSQWPTQMHFVCATLVSEPEIDHVVLLVLVDVEVDVPDEVAVTRACRSPRCLFPWTIPWPDAVDVDVAVGVVVDVGDAELEVSSVISWVPINVSSLKR